MLSNSMKQQYVHLQFSFIYELPINALFPTFQIHNSTSFVLFAVHLISITLICKYLSRMYDLLFFSCIVSNYVPTSYWLKHAFFVQISQRNRKLQKVIIMILRLPILLEYFIWNAFTFFTPIFGKANQRFDIKDALFVKISTFLFVSLTYFSNSLVVFHAVLRLFQMSIDPFACNRYIYTYMYI